MELAALPIRKDWVYEMIARLVPKSSILDEQEGRPCFTRFGLVSDQRSYFILAGQLFPAMHPLHEVVRTTLLKALRTGAARPRSIQVMDERLLRVLGPACLALQISLDVVPELPAAQDALDSIVKHLSQLG
jgi:hypothetical protein